MAKNFENSLAGLFEKSVNNLAFVTVSNIFSFYVRPKFPASIEQEADALRWIPCVSQNILKDPELFAIQFENTTLPSFYRYELEHIVDDLENLVFKYEEELEEKGTYKKARKLIDDFSAFGSEFCKKYETQYDALLEQIETRKNVAA